MTIENGFFSSDSENTEHRLSILYPFVLPCIRWGRLPSQWEGKGHSSYHTDWGQMSQKGQVTAVPASSGQGRAQTVGSSRGNSVNTEQRVAFSQRTGREARRPFFYGVNLTVSRITWYTCTTTYQAFQHEPPNPPDSQDSSSALVPKLSHGFIVNSYCVVDFLVSMIVFARLEDRLVATKRSPVTW